MNLSPIYKIYNVLLFALAIEEIVTILLMVDRGPLHIMINTIFSVMVVKTVTIKQAVNKSW